MPSLFIVRLSLFRFRRLHRNNVVQFAAPLAVFLSAGNRHRSALAALNPVPRMAHGVSFVFKCLTNHFKTSSRTSMSSSGRYVKLFPLIVHPPEYRDIENCDWLTNGYAI
jgi:hypothetical protein